MSVRDPSCGHIVDKIFPKYFPPSERAISYGTSLLSSGIDLSFETYISLREYERSPTQLEDIYTAGSIILHEYTHTLALVVPPLMKETDDGEYIWSVDLARASI